MYHHTLEEGFKYRPDYKWPEPGTEKDCLRCGEDLELLENKRHILENLGGVHHANGNSRKKT